MSTALTGLPALDEPFPVTDADREAFDRDGHVTLRGVASPAEAQAYRPVIADAITRVPAHQPSAAEGEVYAKAFAQHSNLWEFDEAAARFTLARRFGQVAADLLGVDGVRVYHDQALFKTAGGGHTPWHRDQHYWPLDTDRTITMWMPLVDITPDMGELRFAPGTHRAKDVADVPISDEADREYQAYLDRHRFTPNVTGAMAAGDASFHAGGTLHAAAPNTTGRLREVMTIIWFADGARVTEPANDGQRNDLARWLTGCQVGDVAAGPLTPLVFSR